jgi:hypothetical protein
LGLSTRLLLDLSLVKDSDILAALQGKDAMKPAPNLNIAVSGSGLLDDCL